MASVYISPTGNDTTGNGTSGNPWATISKAVSSSSAGDTILCDVANGNFTFVSQVFTTARTIGTFGGTSNAVFDAAAAAGVSWTVNVSLTVSGLTFQNENESVLAADVLFKAQGAGVIVNFTNCIFTNIIWNGGQDYHIFATDNGGTSTATFNLTSCLIYNCTGAAANGALFGSPGAISLAVVLLNCTIYTNAIAGNTLCIVDANAATTTMSVTNCIVWNAGGAVNWTNRGSPTITGTNNDILGWTSPPALTNQIASDALFVDSANGNFNLRPTSPCIGAGTVI